MADWDNLRIQVTGAHAEVSRFRHAAGALTGRIDTRRSAVFTQEMEHGEGGDLEADRSVRFHERWSTASYRFQGRRHFIEHFQAVSTACSTLAFVLAYDGGGRAGSYLLIAGDIRGPWNVPQRTMNAISRRHYDEFGLRTSAQIEADDDSAFIAEVEAGWEGMEIAGRHWDGAVLKWLERARLTRSHGVKRPVRRKKHP